MRDRVVALVAASVMMFVLTFLLVLYRDGAGIVWLFFFLAGGGFAGSAVYIASQSKQST
jgi:hypothetical protein